MTRSDVGVQAVYEIRLARTQGRREIAGAAADVHDEPSFDAGGLENRASPGLYRFTRPCANAGDQQDGNDKRRQCQPLGCFHNCVPFPIASGGDH